jgi:hypothetical protein
MNTQSKKWFDAQPKERQKELYLKYYGSDINNGIWDNEVQYIWLNETMTTEEQSYMDDLMYLPIQYHGIMEQQPFYKGDGNLSVHELQVLCNKYKEYVHQQQIIKQNVMRHLIEVKFSKQ